MEKYFDVCTISEADSPFRPDGDNNYSCFNDLTGNYGVYVFQDKNNSGVFYVGEATNQDLKTRLKQNYTEGDKGGTFRKNWLADNDNDNDNDGKNFSDFKDFLSNCAIKTIHLNNGSKKLISAIESILIAALDPKYNKDK